MCFATTRYKITLGLVLFFLPVLLFARTPLNPKEPEEPRIQLPEIEDVQFDDDPLESTNRLHNTTILVPAQVIIQDKPKAVGHFVIESNIVISLTNRNGKEIDIKTLTIADIYKIEILQWKAVRMEGDAYRFHPVKYRVYIPEARTYDGNLPFLNKFYLQTGGEKKQYFTIYYDYRVKGNKGDFRWKNSHAYDFAFNLNHTIPGVVTAVEFKPQQETVITESGSD